MFCVFDLKLSDLETLAMLRKIKIDFWHNPILCGTTSIYSGLVIGKKHSICNSNTIS